MRVCDHVQNVNRTDTVSPGCHGRRLAGGGRRLQAVDEVRRALRVVGCGEDHAVVCLEHVQPVGNVGGVVLTRLKRQIKIGTEERGAEFGHEFFDRVPYRPPNTIKGGSKE